jgi:hypothetical protein
LQIPTKQWDMAHKQMPKKVENRGSCTEGRQDKPKNPKLNHREATTETLLNWTVTFSVRYKLVEKHGSLIRNI